MSVHLLEFDNLESHWYCTIGQVNILGWTFTLYHVHFHKDVKSVYSAWFQLSNS